MQAEKQSKNMHPCDLYQKAHLAGVAAVQSANVQPMVVTDESRGAVYYVEDGVCGFAWIKIRPAKGAFVKWCKENEIGRVDSYEGGYNIWVHDYNQSMRKKEAYANAFARVLSDNGVNAYSMSRMD